MTNNENLVIKVLRFDGSQTFARSSHVLSTMYRRWFLIYVIISVSLQAVQAQSSIPTPAQVQGPAATQADLEVKKVVQDTLLMSILLPKKLSRSFGK